jgi:HlyD family secretion protein
MTIVTLLFSRTLHAAVVFLLISATIGLTSAFGQTTSVPAKPALTVTLVQAKNQNISNVVSANGVMAAWQEASISAGAQGLKVVELLAEVGDTVKKGQLLARFDQDTVNADIAVAKAQMQEAQASADDIKSTLANSRLLEKEGFYSPQAVSQFVIQEKAALAKLEAAKANLLVQTLRLQYSELRAPDDGVISVRVATVGSVVAAGAELFRMNRQNRLEWRADVTVTELAQIKPGGLVSLDAGGGVKVRGTVRKIAPNLDAQTRNALVYVDVHGVGPFKVGQFVRGEFAGSSLAALTLPVTAIVQRDGFSYVFAVMGNRVTQIKVTLGLRSGTAVAVQGLKSDTAVVASGASFLSDGDLVKVVQP